VQKLELELAPVFADEAALQHGGADEALVVEQAVEPSAAIIAGFEQWRVFLGFARRPTAHIVMLWL
jgi:hypothetical protein